MLAGTALFVAGFAAVFVAAGVVFGAVGQALVAWQRPLSVIAGVVSIGLGLAFAGMLPIGRREVRLKRLPAVGLAGAPLLGIVFGLGWTPCLGPTLGVVINLALTDGSAARGALLAFVYALGLGLPFLLAAAAFPRMTRLVDVVRRHQLVLLRVGGGLMIAVGLILITGWWELLTAALPATGRILQHDHLIRPASRVRPATRQPTRRCQPATLSPAYAAAVITGPTPRVGELPASAGLRPQPISPPSSPSPRRRAPRTPLM